MTQEDMGDTLSDTDAVTGEDPVAGEEDMQADGSEPARDGAGSEAAAGQPGKPALSNLQAAAGAFNTAFASMLSELESSHQKLEESSARIAELDETVRFLREALDEETGKIRTREEEHLQEKNELEQRIHDAESARDLLQKKMQNQERALQERASEMSELFTRIEQMKTDLGERDAAAEQAQEEFANERKELDAKFDGLQAQYDEANNRLKAQQDELEERARELDTLRDQIAGLQSGIESREAEAARLNQQVTELQGELETQAEAGVAARAELEAGLSGLGAELEAQRTSHADLKAHAENLERLNQALHESSITEQKVHRQQLDERAAEIALLRSRLESAGEPAESSPDSAAEADVLGQTLHRLEADLEELRAQNRELGMKAAETDRVVHLNQQLRAALGKAREQITRKGGDSGDAQQLHVQVAEMQAALDGAQAREEELAGKLQAFAALEQEVIELREAATAPRDGQDVQVDTDRANAALRREVENLKEALSDSEEKCRQLHAAYTSSHAGRESGVVLQMVPDRPGDTAAPARARFIEQVDELLAGRDDGEEPHALMYLLLDNFIGIRDELGVVESEAVIREFGAIIEAACAAGDILARFGDCTFAVLCRNAGVAEAEERAAAICSSVESRIFEEGGRSLVTTTSIGICAIGKTDASAKELIQRADLACETARMSGGNRVVASSAVADGMNLRGSDGDHAEMVRRTLEEERIKAYYQPIMSLREHTATQFEVLIRLVDEAGDMILPGEFFALAEGAGCSGAVDRYVIEHTMRVIAGSSDRQVRFFVKLTRQSVLDESLPDWIAQKIGEYGIGAEQLVFEIAEHFMQGDLRNVASLSESLNEIGCKVAIEHYRLSTGQQHLMHVHADYLKIDRGVISGIEGKGENLAMITEIMELAKNNNCTTIAEGVETSGCLAMLWELGVNMAQGYFIQVPTADREHVEHGPESDAPGDISGKATFELG